ncbi:MULTISPECIES: GGDEF domain-containing protein [Clostridium]|uniref:GGDEF domain-containing protein n=1 Tax=Clostridium TaxID=1485 RepID=UPI0008259FD0|nr:MULTISPECIES: GGDEF domain-containing protein [Clostridium]PJI07007.1 GGDEF domain-containing protein [Clostridium sp. CT7]
MINNLFGIIIGQNNLEVTPAHINEVNDEIREINYKRFFVFSIVTGIIELILIVFYDIPSINKGNCNLIDIMYLFFHSCILITSLTVFFILKSYRKNESKKTPCVIAEIPILLFMIFVACISGLDQITSGQVTSYITGLLICGVLALIKPPRNYLIYSISHIIFICLSLMFQKDQGILLNNIINGTVFYFSVLVLSKLTYENQINILIKNIILEETNNKLKYISNYDALTNLFNRRYFETVIKRSIIENKSYKNKEAIIAIMDIDYFKSINDKYGHKAGDVVLQETSAIIDENIRKIDLAARWGGEEFIILFPDISAKNAEIIVNRIRQKIEENRVLFDNNSIQVTASFGLTRLMGNTEENFENCFKTADKALYLAKTNGRNRVEKFFE